jgi:serine phosphatase RsbU (regulator of sigma subunit)
MGPPNESNALLQLVEGARLAPPHELAALIDECAHGMGAERGVAYLADIQQQVLVPFLPPAGPGEDDQLTALNVDSTLAGRTFQTFEVTVQDAGAEGVHTWLPLLVGTDRLGVLGLTVRDESLLKPDGPLTPDLLTAFASTTAALLVSKMPYGDTLVRLRRRATIGLAAEIQYSLLPPLTFASRPVTVAAALEPCYAVAGDTIDYAVDADVTRLGVFDGMGHGLQSAQCSVLTVGAYRNSRRAGSSLMATLTNIDDVLQDAFAGEFFTTAVLAELDTATGMLQWVNAGHPDPILLRAGRVVKSLHVDPRPPLGLGYLPDSVVAATIGQEQLEPGDQLLFYTDGVIEARSPDGDFFGLDRLTDLLVRHLAGGLPAPETLRRAVRELLHHQQDQLSDDATLLLVEWRGGNEESMLV